MFFCVLTHDRFLHDTEIPGPLPRVNTGANDDVRLDGVPVNVRNSAEMGP